jgi:hypothetical protein
VRHSAWDWAGASAARPEEDGDGVWLGIFTEKGPAEMAETAALEAKLDRRFASIMWFADFSLPFPAEAAKAAWDSGALPNVTWEPWLWTDNQRIHLADINGGTWDSYIAAWGAGAAAFGKPVLVRWGHEFNGNWYPWGLAKNGQSAKAYIEAYRRVHDIVAKAGAANVIWVWSPNADSVPAESWNDPIAAYPGDEYVDWVAIDGYDFDGKLWFSDIFAATYAEVSRKIDKPIFVGETATGRKGAEKAAWIDEMHEALATRFPGIKGVTWFNVKKERDWRLDESGESLAGARAVFSLPLYRSRPDAIPLLADRFYHDRSSYKEQQPQRKSLAAPRLSRDAAGALDWASAPALEVSGAGGLGGVVRLGWDAEGLHALAELRSGHPLTNQRPDDGIWDGDCLEICVSTDPAADPERKAFTETDWQLGFAPADSVAELPARSWEWSKLKSAIPGAEAKSFSSKGGYGMEISLPWAALGGFAAAAGQSLGFDLAVDDAGAEGGRATQWIWNGTSAFYKDPSQWGTLVLKD